MPLVNSLAMKRTIVFISIFILGISISAIAQKPKPATVQEGALYFSLIGEKNGKKITIAKDYGRAVTKDSLRLANQISCYYKAGQKITNIKDITYDSFFLSDSLEPTVLQDQRGMDFDASIWQS